MHRLIGNRLFAGLVGLCLVDAAVAQRVELGNALDANPYLGSGGRNASRPVWPIFGSNLIVSGNVTGGWAFRGFSPISSPTSFGLRRPWLPSATLGSFWRDSVGISDFRSQASPLVHRPFFFPSQTVLNVRQISTGLNRPGSSAPASAYSPLARPVTASIDAQRFEQPRPPQPPSAGQPASVLPQQAATGQERLSPLLGRSILFAPRLQIERLSQLQRPADRQQAEQEAPATPPQSSAVDVLPDSPLAELLRPMPAGPELQPTAPPSPTAELRTAQVPTGQPIASSVLTELPPAGQDTFADMVNAVRFAEQFTDAFLAAMRQRLEQQAAQDRVRAQARLDRQDLQRRILQDPRLQDPKLTPAERARLQLQIRQELLSAWAAQHMTTPISTFAGRAPSLLNKYLKQAEQLLLQGKYYLAVRRYEIAQTIDPDNPLPLLGKGHALIGAGEYRSAVLALTQGIAR
ncbi:MAG: hypothetical protein ACE5K7_06480, partial [Phycisphaerae bacterium]